MDRFIVISDTHKQFNIYNLKSNMDRFIVHKNHLYYLYHIYLKSNMDRFIVLACFVGLGLVSAFKILYG